jgi:hypothetical protein
MSLDELIQAAQKLDETDLEQLLYRVVVLRASRKAQVLPEEEAQLLLCTLKPLSCRHALQPIHYNSQSQRSL